MKEATIYIDGSQYSLILDGNAHTYIEEKTGLSLLDMSFHPSDIGDIAILLHACLQSSAPELTFEKLVESLGMQHLPFILEAIQFLLLGNDGSTRSNDELAPYVPTPQYVANEMATKIPKGATVLDIGCGDGSLLVAAIRAGAEKVLGYERDLALVEAARANISVACLQAGTGCLSSVAHRNVVDTRTGELYDLPWVAEADVVMMYLLHTTNVTVGSYLDKHLKPGAIVLSHDFPIHGWEALLQEVSIVPGENKRKHRVYVYRRPSA